MSIPYYILYTVVTVVIAKYYSQYAQTRMSIPWARLTYMLLVGIPLISPQVGLLFFGRFLSPFGIDFTADLQVVFLLGSIIALYFGLKYIP